MGWGEGQVHTDFLHIYVGAVQQASNQAFPQGLQKKRHAKAQVPTNWTWNKILFLNPTIYRGVRERRKNFSSEGKPLFQRKKRKEKRNGDRSFFTKKIK